MSDTDAGAATAVEPADAAPTANGQAWWRTEARSLLELVGLCGIAVTQPTLDALRTSGVVFIQWRTTSLELVVLACVLALGPPLALWAIECAIAAVRRSIRPAVHAVLAGGVGAIIASAAVKAVTEWGAVAVGIAAAAGGIGIGALVARFAMVRTWLRVMAILPVVLALLFVTTSPAAKVVHDRDPPLSDAPIGRPARVIVLVMDELPLASLLDGRGAIDRELFPRFAALADDSTWYRNSTTVSPATETAVPSILAGALPRDEHDIGIAGNYPRNLFTLLGSTYDLHVQEAVTRLCPESRCTAPPSSANLQPGLRGMLGDVTRIWWNLVSPWREEQEITSALGALEYDALSPVQRFIAGMRPSGEQPRLDFLHMLLPHFPWHYNGLLQDASAFPAHTNGLEDGYWPTDHIGALSRTRHLVQLQATDTLLGQIIDRLRAFGEYDDSLIVVTADHGISFEGGTPIRGVTADTWPEIMWTPLFVKAPGQRGGAVDDRPALSIDVLPTIADHLDTDPGWEWDGRSLLGAAEPDGDRPLLDWKDNDIDAPVRDDYLTFDGPTGFARVLQDAAGPPGDPAFRPYRATPFGELVGTPTVAHPTTPQPGPTAEVDAFYKYLSIDPIAPKAPWLDVHAWVDLEPGLPVAVSMNGTIGAISETYRAPGSTRTELWALVPAHLFRAGGNGLALHLLTGPRDRPVLQPMPLVGTPE